MIGQLIRDYRLEIDEAMLYAFPWVRTQEYYEQTRKPKAQALCPGGLCLQGAPFFDHRQFFFLTSCFPVLFTGSLNWIHVFNFVHLPFHIGFRWKGATLEQEIGLPLAGEEHKGQSPVNWPVPMGHF